MTELPPWVDRPGEEWRPVLDAPEFQVSNFGRVRRGDDTDQLLTISCARYKVVNINGRTRAVHVLVLEAFVGPRPSGMWACHGDGDNWNNCLENLRWDTPKANQRDRDEHGNTVRGQRVHSAKLTDEDVREVRRLRESGVPVKEIARLKSVSTPTIYRATSGTSWRHV